MKKLCVVLVTLLLAATPAFAVITNSAHDLSGTSTFTSSGTGTPQYGSSDTDRLCVFCHTPHGALSDAPLWNRNNADLSGLAANEQYDSSTMNHTPDYTTGDIELCMSCHDGDMTRALINLNGATSGVLTPLGGRSLTIPNDTPANVGGDAAVFSNDHPVGFTYNPALDTGLNAIGVFGGAIDVPADLLRGTNEMWCSSCHNVHEPGTLVAGNYPFLRMDNSGSALCLICHIK
jgi:cytochrome c553